MPYFTRPHQVSRVVKATAGETSTVIKSISFNDYNNKIVNDDILERKSRIHRISTSLCLWKRLYPVHLKENWI